MECAICIRISGGASHSLQKNSLHILDTQRASPTTDIARCRCMTLNCSTFAFVDVLKYEPHSNSNCFDITI